VWRIADSGEISNSPHTGAGQIAEITRQLRGEAGVRQQPNAETGLAHMVGVGAACVVHILQKGA